MKAALSNCPKCGAPANDDGSFACGAPLSACNPTWMFSDESWENQRAIERDERRDRRRGRR